MNFNKFSISDNKEKKQYKMDKYNPSQKLLFLLNLYHSIDLKHLNSSDKEEAKRMIKKEVAKLYKFFGDSHVTSIKLSLTNREYWHDFKNCLN